MRAATGSPPSHSPVPANSSGAAAPLRRGAWLLLIPPAQKPLAPTQDLNTRWAGWRGGAGWRGRAATDRGGEYNVEGNSSSQHRVGEQRLIGEGNTAQHWLWHRGGWCAMDPCNVMRGATNWHGMYAVDSSRQCERGHKCALSIGRRRWGRTLVGWGCNWGNGRVMVKKWCGRHNGRAGEDKRGAKRLRAVERRVWTTPYGFVRG